MSQGRPCPALPTLTDQPHFHYRRCSVRNFLYRHKDERSGGSDFQIRTQGYQRASQVSIDLLVQMVDSSADRFSRSAFSDTAKDETSHGLLTPDPAPSSVDPPRRRLKVLPSFSEMKERFDRSRRRSRNRTAGPESELEQTQASSYLPAESEAKSLRLLMMQIAPLAYQSSLKDW